MPNNRTWMPCSSLPSTTCASTACPSWCAGAQARASSLSCPVSVIGLEEEEEHDSSSVTTDAMRPPTIREGLAMAGEARRL
eukprot:764671-Hanusia_phi.AAC.3